MSQKFTREADLCAAFMAVLPEDWVSYPETGGFDLLLVLLPASREAAGAYDQRIEASEVLQAAELEAAEIFARKKRLGSYRSEPLPEAWAERSKVWRREAGAMARAGFGVDTIRKVLNQEPEGV